VFSIGEILFGKCTFKKKICVNQNQMINDQNLMFSVSLNFFGLGQTKIVLHTSKRNDLP